MSGESDPVDVSLAIRRIFACLLAVALVVLVAAPASASASIRLGAFNSGAPANAQTLAEYAQLVGRQPEIVLWYTDFGTPLLTEEQIATLNATGQAPMVTWEPYDQSLADIAAGRYDSYLRESARIARDWGGELMVRFAHEMNGDWFPWGRSSSYVAAWRHIVTVFREVGASNVRWVWAPNVDRNGSMPFAPYFPGDEWVDYVGLDGYNWGATPGNHWASLEEVFASSYATITQLSAKPLLITETASSEVGGDKAAWIRTGFLQTIPRRFPRVTGVIWFNLNKEDDWRVNSSQAALDAYREVVSCSLYGGSEPCGVEGVEGGEGDVTVEAVTVTPRVSGPPPRSASPRGAVSYELSDQARVRVKIQRRRHGHHRRGRRFSRRATISLHGRRGRNRVTLRRLLRARRLGRGRYRVVVAVRGSQGGRSRSRSAHFRIR